MVWDCKWAKFIYKQLSYGPLIDVKMCFSSISSKQIDDFLLKFCICIDKYKINVVSNARLFWSIFNRVMALDRHQNFVYAKYLVN